MGRIRSKSRVDTIFRPSNDIRDERKHDRVLHVGLCAKTVHCTCSLRRTTVGGCGTLLGQESVTSPPKDEGAYTYTTLTAKLRHVSIQSVSFLPSQGGFPTGHQKYVLREGMCLAEIYNLSKISIAQARHNCLAPVGGGGQSRPWSQANRTSGRHQRSKHCLLRCDEPLGSHRPDVVPRKGYRG